MTRWITASLLSILRSIQRAVIRIANACHLPGTWKNSLKPVLLPFPASPTPSMYTLFIAWDNLESKCLACWKRNPLPSVLWQVPRAGSRTDNLGLLEFGGWWSHFKGNPPPLFMGRNVLQNMAVSFWVKPPQRNRAEGDILQPQLYVSEAAPASLKKGLSLLKEFRSEPSPHSCMLFLAPFPLIPIEISSKNPQIVKRKYAR